MRRTVVGGLMVLGLIALGGWNQLARADVGQGGGFTDYGNYPPELPAGCPDWLGALQGVSFSSSAGGSGGLGGLALAGGDTVTMSWDSVAEGCASPDGQPAVAVTLASHEMATGSFDVGENQLLLDWASCGPGDPCGQDAGGRYQLTLTLPSGAVACHAQVDAVVGPPLGMVGPSGSYYTGGLRPNGGATTLIAAGFAHAEPCEETPDTTPDETVDTTPDTTPDETIETTPDETPDETPDTTPETTDSVPDETGSDPGAQTSDPATPAQDQLVALPATTATDSVSVESTNPVQPATAVLGITASRADLPTTGARTDELVVAAAALIVLGAITRAAGARWALRQRYGFQPGA